jgi:hypothetical protein
MEFNSNIKTKSGYPLDIVKNAIQQYARRGMATKMLEAVSEIDSFKIYDDGRINMINLLKVILFEDVSFSQVGAFTTVCEKIKKWEDDRDEKMLAEIVSIIAHAKKLRMPSWLRINYGIEKECFIEKDDFLRCLKEKDKDISFVEWIYHHEEEALEMLDDYEFPGKEYILPMCKAEWKRFTGASAPSFTEKEIEAAYKNCDVQFEDFVYDMEEEIVYNEDSVWLAPYEFIKEWYEEYPGKPAPVAELWVPETETEPKAEPETKPKQENTLKNVFKKWF